MKQATQLRNIVNKIFRHSKRNIRQTRKDYQEDCLLFADWLGQEYKAQGFRNLRDQHLREYGKYLLAKGHTPGGIKKKLAAIRYMHEHVPNARYSLTSDNVALGVPKREKTPNRAWNEEEVALMKEKATSDKAPQHMEELLELARFFGLRIEEAVVLRDSDIRRALINGYFSLMNTKGGRPRATRDLDAKIKKILKKLLKVTPRGEYVFVPPGVPVHVQINRIQQWLYRHRPKREEGPQITMHGLRYSYVQGELKTKKEEGWDKKDAQKDVAKKTGHNRTSTTSGYASGGW